MMKIIGVALGLLLLFLLIMSAVAYRDAAQAQRVHRDYFECIGAGFSSSQCNFLAEMLRKRGVN